MNTYEVRKQIQKENKNKLIGEIGMVLFLLVILCCIVFVGRLSNPFHVLDSKNGKDLVKEYEAGTDYVKVRNATLEFTGYYKEDKNNNILYNCYATVIGEEKFFVFVPAKRSGKDPKDPDKTLSNYSFTARMHKDSELLSVVAKDYELTVEELVETDVISTIVLDEADLDLTRMYIIWIALICVILLCILYCIISYVHLKSIYKRKEILELQKYGPIDEVLDAINEEVANHLVFDSIALKITEQYLLAFRSGKVYIQKCKYITNVLITSKVKKAYGIVKLGYENFLQIYEGEQVVFELPMENEIEAKEILEVMNRKKQ
ncbi:hypothetical protein [Anaerosporobacter faecicola]|uniref:hypothetical protein n=1 Tax=Anaerosporobacter faecicola TaxID=2718714 RepID=UPI00143CA7A0|nr:hypothetical protein [Anaerosporobacter faecicola]